MAFPTNPLNNEVAIVNNITYRYNISNNVWNRIATSNVGFVAVTANTFIANNEVFVNNVNILSYTQAAFNAANAASSNTIVIQGVNTTQNTNITVADTKAQAAFNTANTKFNSSGGTITGPVSIDSTLVVTGNLIVSGNTFSVQSQTLDVVDPLIILGKGNYTTDTLDIGFVGHYNAGANAHTGLIRDFSTKDWYLFQEYTPEVTGNNNVNISHPSFDTANLIAKRITANIVASTVTIGGQDQSLVDATQNTRITIAEGVDVGQNTRMSIIEGVDVGQNTRMSIIEGVDVGQNTRMTIIEGVDTTQNTNITNADTKAQAAFNKANDAFTLANTANAAASSGGSSETFTTYIDRFTGNGSQTQFTLSTTPDTENQTMVFLNGVYQNKDVYSVSGANVVFTDTATANDTIEVATFVRVVSVNSSMYKTRIYQGDGSTTTFTISSGHTANTILLFNNGVAQFPVDDYTVSGTTLTYVLTPASDETIQIRELPISTLVPATQALMRRYTANGVQTQFTVTSGQTANSMFVYENGICQVPINDYTVSGTILTFTTAPVANVVVQIRELSI